MRIAATVNGKSRYVASIPGAGFLSAHLNLSDRPKEGTAKQVLRVEGFDTNVPTENVSLKWPEIVLTIGDTVELRVLEDGPADPPAVRRSSTESLSNLFSDTNLARELISLCEDFERRLFDLMRKSEGVEPLEEHQKFKRAIGNIVVDLGQHLLSPVYRRHAELVPDDPRGELL